MKLVNSTELLQPATFMMLTMYALSKLCLQCLKVVTLRPQRLLCLIYKPRYIVFVVNITRHKMEILVRKGRCALIRACALIRRNMVTGVFNKAICHKLNDQQLFNINTHVITAMHMRAA